MKRRVLLSFGVALIAALTVTVAATAANPHLKNPNPVLFTDNGLTLTATLSYAGLGNFDTNQVLTAQGNPTSVCTNPSGKQQPPGQNPAPATFGGSTPVGKDDIKNGNVTISTTTAAPTSPITGAPDCPGSSWTETITDVAFTSALIRLFQDQDGNGSYETLVLTVSCTFNSPTSNGAVPSSNFSCTSS